MRTKHLYIAILLWTIGLSLVAQISNDFLYYPTTNFSRSTFMGGTQSWDIDQDKEGWMYFANNNGMLEYDGNNWRVFPIKNESIVRSVYVSDAEKRIYAGATNEFGYFSYDKEGVSHYTSLIHLAPLPQERIGIIWHVLPLGDGVCFTSGKRDVFIYKDDEITIYSMPSEIEYATSINDVLYISTIEGLHLFTGDDFALLPHTEELKGLYVRGILPLNNNELLIATQSSGLFVYKNRELKPWANQSNELLKKNRIYSLASCSKYIAVGTIRGGVVLLNKQGKQVRCIDRKSGLQNNTVLSLFFDKDESLWLGLDNGIDLVYTHSPLTNLYEGDNYIGSGYCSLIDGDNIYLGTNLGLFSDGWSQGSDVHTVSKPSLLLDGQVWGLQQIENELFCSHQDGLYTIKDGRVECIDENLNGVWHVIEYDQQTLIAGTYTGFYVVKKEGNRWRVRNKIAGFDESCRVLTWDIDGSLWMAHGNIGIYRFYFDDNLRQITQQRFYGEKDGLPQNINNDVFRLNNTILFNTQNGLYKFNRSNNRIEKCEENALVKATDNVQLLRIDESDGYWYGANFSLGYYRETMEETTNLFGFFYSKLIGGFNHIETVGAGKAIVSTEDGFSYIDINRLKGRNSSPRTSIRSIYSTYPTDSLLVNDIAKNNQRIEIPYSCNNLRITWSTPVYEPYSLVEYSCMLEGLKSATWSEWGQNSVQSYTELPAGEYTFRLRSRSVYIDEVTEQVIYITILPPWYHSTLAYTIYNILFLTVIFFVFRLVNRTIHRKTEHVMAVNRREIDERNEQISKLKEERLADELRMKNQELSNSVMNVIRKNEILLVIKEQVAAAYTSNLNKDKAQVGRQLLELQNIIKENISYDDEWTRFEENYDRANFNFLRRLEHKHPTVSVQDKKLCVFLKMGLSTKEMAPMLSISDRGVEIARYRLRKKLGLTRSDNLVDYLMHFDDTAKVE